MIGVHVRTPAWFAPRYRHFYDPMPYSGEGLAIPNPLPPKANDLIYWNGDYSRLDESLPQLIDWHREGHYVELLIPMGDNEEARTLRRYGIRRLFPDRRIFPEVRNVKVVILTGENQG